MNEIIKNMLERRSIRKYKSEQITEEELNTILHAAEYAPNAGSRQSALILVCQDEKTNLELGKINKMAMAFGNRAKTGNFYISKEQPSIIDDPTIQSAFYGAPTVISLFAPKDFIYAPHDCCVMAENIMLAAHSIGIGSCMVGRAEATFESELGKKLQKEWGIDESYEAKVHITLGYPVTRQATSKPRRENRIIKA